MKHVPSICFIVPVALVATARVCFAGLPAGARVLYLKSMFNNKEVMS